MSGTFFLKTPSDLVHMNFAMDEVMTPPVALCGGNQEEAGHGAVAATGELNAQHWLRNESTGHWRLDVGHHLDERSLENCGPKIQEGDAPRQRCDGQMGMLAMNEHCGLLHRYCGEWNTLADEPTPRQEKAGSSWGSCEGRPAAVRVFFDGGVDGVEEIKQEHKFLDGAAWILQTWDTWETGQDPRWGTRLEVCSSIPRGTTVT